jgi:hypothetical protein
MVVDSAAWVGLAGERKVVAYIGTQAFTRQLVEKSGYFDAIIFCGNHGGGPDLQ